MNDKGNRRSRIASFVHLAFFFCILCSFSLECSAQSLADIARKERDRKKDLKSTVVIATGGSAIGIPTTTAAGTASTSQAATSPGAPKDNNGHDEKYWRDRFQKARDDVQRADAKTQIIETKIKDLNTQLLRQSDVYNRENRIGAGLADAQKELEDARKQADESKQKVTDLEDELRRAGGPPGWSR